MRRIVAQARKDLTQLVRDRLALALALVLPVCLTALLGTSISLTVTDIALVIQDLDQTPLSRQYADAFRSSLTFRIVGLPPAALPESVLSRSSTFEVPAAAWEAELLPARLDDYDFTWLDDLCLSGRAVWTRLSLSTATTSTQSPGPIRTSPVALLPRRAASLWNRLATKASAQPIALGSRAQRIADYLSEHGASFYDEIVDGTGLLRTQVEEALAELVAYGVATSDSFAGLRALLTPSEKRKPFGARRAHRRALFGIEDAGRWALLKRPQAPSAPTPIYADYDQPTLEHIAHTLLRRYGVVFWRVLQREASWLPPWRELLRVLRRLEARGDIRGGRFVAGISGEQFALPEAVQTLRETRRVAMAGELIAVSGADPLNLVGVLLPGAKVPALTGNRVLYRDGAAVAALIGGEIRWFEPLEGLDASTAEAMLIQRRIGSPLLAYLR